MTLQAFEQTLIASQPPPEFSVYVQALWYDAKDDWEKAHLLVQDLTDARAAVIHAYLHRKEGDKENANYWYRRAGETMPQISLQEEWRKLVQAML